MHPIPVVIFSLLLIIAVIIFLDEYGTSYFKPRVFKRGILFYRRIIKSENGFVFIPLENQTISKDEGIFFFHSNGKIYFRSRRFQTQLSRFHSVGFLGTGERIDNFTIRVTARFPLGLFMMLMFFAMMFTLGSLLMGALAVFAGSVIFFGGLMLIINSIDRGRMNRMCEELKGLMCTATEQKSHSSPSSE